eukprot:gene32676-17690_t
MRPYRLDYGQNVKRESVRFRSKAGHADEVDATRVYGSAAQSKWSEGSHVRALEILFFSAKENQDRQHYLRRDVLTRVVHYMKLGKGLPPHIPVKSNVADRIKQTAAETKVPTTAPSKPTTRAPPMDKSRVLTNSVPAVLPGGDLPLQAWQAIGRWMRANTLASAFGLEKGAVELNLDAQGVVRMRLETYVCDIIYRAEDSRYQAKTTHGHFMSTESIFHHETDGAGRQTRQQKHESLKRKLEPMLEVFNEAEDYD